VDFTDLFVIWLVYNAKERCGQYLWLYEEDQLWFEFMASVQQWISSRRVLGLSRPATLIPLKRGLKQKYYYAGKRRWSISELGAKARWVGPIDGVDVALCYEAGLDVPSSLDFTTRFIHLKEQA